MQTIVTGIKIAIMSILAIFYWPVNTFYLWLRKHYLDWEKTDRVSFYLATPLYYLMFFIVMIISQPLEAMGEAYHPPLKGFK